MIYFLSDLNIIQTLKDLVTCSHARAVLFFIESINSKCMMRSYSCETKWLFDNGQCSSCTDHLNECQIMGFYARMPPSKLPVQYHLATRSRSPFCGKFRFSCKLEPVRMLNLTMENSIFVSFDVMK